MLAGCSSEAVFDLLGREEVPFGSVAQRKISKSDQQNAPEPFGLAGVELPGLAMACSLWDSLQGFRDAPLAYLT
jgi:hypothetical protein